MVPLSLDELIKVWGDLPILGFMLSAIKVSVKRDVPPIQLPHLKEGLKEGSEIELPFWLAEVLRDEGFVEFEGRDLSSELFKALSRERLQGEFQLSTLRPDFITELRLELKGKDGPLALRYKDLITIRSGKLSRLAGLMPKGSELRGKMGMEERMLFDFLVEAIDGWKKVVMP